MHILRDPTCTLGGVVCELGDAYLHTGGGAAANTNGTTLFRLLIFEPSLKSPSLPDGVTLAGLRAASKHLKRQVALIDEFEVASHAPPTPAPPQALTRATPQRSGAVNGATGGLRLAADLGISACLLGQAMIRHECELQALPVTQKTDIANRLLPQVGARPGVRGGGRGSPSAPAGEAAQVAVAGGEPRRRPRRHCANSVAGRPPAARVAVYGAPHDLLISLILSTAAVMAQIQMMANQWLP